MILSHRIVSITAREVFSPKGYPCVESTVITKKGAIGTAIAVAGTSVGEKEAKFVYDENSRLLGWGVQRAVENVINVIAPALIGLDITKQLEIDDILINLDTTTDKSKLGANAIGSVSAAVLKAGAKSLGIPLYKHIGGVNACTIPVPGVMTVRGSYRYGDGENSGGKPTYAIMCYGFNNFREAAYAGWKVFAEYIRILNMKYKLGFTMEHYSKLLINCKMIKHDRELWDTMVEAITNLGYEGKMGIQVDVAASTYFNKASQKYTGLFSAGDKTKDDLINIYKEMKGHYPFIIIEDPLEEDDFEGHAYLTKELGIEIVGDDLFAMDIYRLKKAIRLGAGNSVLLKVYQRGTISEAFEVVRFAYRHGYRIMPCSSRGEGADIADYAVGLNTGYIREGAIDEVGNRLLKIESELGNTAKFIGKEFFLLRL